MFQKCFVFSEAIIRLLVIFFESRFKYTLQHMCFMAVVGNLFATTCAHSLFSTRFQYADKPVFVASTCACWCFLLSFCTPHYKFIMCVYMYRILITIFTCIGRCGLLVNLHRKGMWKGGVESVLGVGVGLGWGEWRTAKQQHVCMSNLDCGATIDNSQTDRLAEKTREMEGGRVGLFRD